MNYKFTNNGNVYKFNDSFCGSEYISYAYEVKNIELVRNNCKNIIDKIINSYKNNYIKIDYIKMTDNSDEIKTDIVYIRNNEIENAEIVVEYINKIVQEKLQKELEKQKKQEEKVKVIDSDGDEHFVNSYSSQLSDDKLCLITEDGKTYHTWLDCYQKWLPSMKNSFDYWIIKKKSEVIKDGYNKCQFCEERDYDSEHFDEVLSELEDN